MWPYLVIELKKRIKMNEIQYTIVKHIQQVDCGMVNKIHQSLAINKNSFRSSLETARYDECRISNNNKNTFNFLRLGD